MMFKKLFNLFKKENTKFEMISNMNDNHTIHKWHEDLYMDSDGHVYEVTRKLPKVKEVKEPSIITLIDEVTNDS